MVRTSPEVIRYYNDPDNYSFFDKNEEMISLTVMVRQKDKDKVLEFVRQLKRQEETEQMQKQAYEEPQEDKSTYKDFKHPVLTNALKQAHKRETLKDCYQFSFEDFVDKINEARKPSEPDDCPF